MSDDAIPAMPWRWTGEALEPASSTWARMADRYLVVGQVYTLEERLERSSKSHAHYFACIREMWMSLPEAMAERFQSADHLRRFALIKTGYRDERSIVCASKAEALRVAAFVRPIDPFAIVIVQGSTVIILTAKTQSYRGMDRKTFGESKTAVLDYLSEMLGVTPDEAKNSATEAA